MNPYVMYHGHKFSPTEFIELSKQFPDSFLHYCETIVDSDGGIYLASPSHQEIMKYLVGVKNLEKYDFDILAAAADYGMSVVWYNRQSGGCSIAALSTLRTLASAGLIRMNLFGNFVSQEEAVSG